MGREESGVGGEEVGWEGGGGVGGEMEEGKEDGCGILCGQYM